LLNENKTRKSLNLNDLEAPGARKRLALNNLRRKYLARIMNLAIRGLARRLLAWENKNSNKLKKYLDILERIDYIKSMKQEMVSRYEWAKARFENGLISQDEWFKLCFEILSEIMEENKDVFIRLKNR
jgi:hypothetical protein